MHRHNYFLRNTQNRPEREELIRNVPSGELSSPVVQREYRNRGIHTTPMQRNRNRSPTILEQRMPMSDLAAHSIDPRDERFRAEYHDRINRENIYATVRQQNNLNPRGSFLHGGTVNRNQEDLMVPPLINFRVPQGGPEANRPERFIGRVESEVYRDHREPERFREQCAPDMSRPPPQLSNTELSGRLLRETPIEDRCEGPRQSTLEALSPVCINDTDAINNLNSNTRHAAHGRQDSVYNDYENERHLNDIEPVRMNEQRFREGRRVSGNVHRQNTDPNNINLGAMSLNNQNMQRVISVAEPTIPTFTGIPEEFKDFKELFLAITSGYTSDLRVLFLKQNLDKKSKNYVAHINASDHDAEQRMWAELDRTYNHNKTKANFHLGKLMQAARWSRCRSKDDLEELFLHLRYHYTQLCNEGDQYRSQAEVIKNFVTPALYGKSFDKLNWIISRGEEYDMERVLFILEEHIHFERSKETAQSQSITSGYSKPNRYDDRYDRSRKNYDQEGHYRSSSGDRSSNRIDYREKERASRDTSRNRDASRSKSPSSNIGDYGRYQQHSRNRSSSPHKAAVYLTSAESSQAKNRTYRDRERSRSPGSRGERAYSPGRNIDTDKYRYKCHVCKTNGHSTMNCRVKSSEEMLLLSRESGLCFKCFVRGHMATVCPLDKECKSPECKGLMGHNEILCKALKAGRQS